MKFASRPYSTFSEICDILNVIKWAKIRNGKYMKAIDDTNMRNIKT